MKSEEDVRCWCRKSEQQLCITCLWYKKGIFNFKLFFTETFLQRGIKFVQFNGHANYLQVENITILVMPQDGIPRSLNKAQRTDRSLHSVP